jgi:radical SAM superfamily enzyme YgiQ (UPF0313 family)
MNLQEILFWDLKNTDGTSKSQFEEGIGPYKLAQIARAAGIETIVFQDHNFHSSAALIAEETEHRPSTYWENTALAFSVLSSGVDLFFAILKKISNFRLPIIIGGAGATLEPRRIMEKALAILPSDVPVVLVEGDGEEAFREIIFTAPKQWQELKKIWRRDNNGEIAAGRYNISDISKSPFSFLESSQQRKLFRERSQIAGLHSLTGYNYLRALTNSQLEIGKGCYFRCGFCNTSCLQHQQVRKKSPEAVVKEMLALYREYGITFFSFTDNVAFDKAEYWEEFSQILGSCPESPYLFFGGYSAPRFLADEQWLKNVLPKLYRVGLRSVIIGVQAGSKRILHDIVNRPDTDPEDALRIVRAAVALGINVKIDFIIGHPTETADDLGSTYDLMQQLRNLGGELFVRKLNVIPFSRYDLMLKQGAYRLPEETAEWSEIAQKILSLKRDDSVYRQLAMARGVPNKYLLDRKLGIIYPHEIFAVEELETNWQRLCDSSISDNVRVIFDRMFELMIKYKKTNR